MVDMSKLECRDCFNEALMDLGIPQTAKIPRYRMKAFRAAYEMEFYHTHDNPKGPRAAIVPW